MALKDWFSRRTLLQLALERGMRPGADLQSELFKLGEFTITSKADAEAVCEVLEKLATDGSPPGGSFALGAVIRLFQNVDEPDCPAFPVMAEQGMRLLMQIVESAMRAESRLDQDDVLMALKMLAMYGTRAGTGAVLRAARLPLKPDDYMWSVILSAYTNEHPGRKWLFK
jgi:hypothetical protein